MSVNESTATEKTRLQRGEKTVVLIPAPGRQLSQHIDLCVGDGGPRELPWRGNRLLAAVSPAGHHLTISIDQCGSHGRIARPERLPRQLEGQLSDRWQRCCFVTRHAPILPVLKARGELRR